MSKSSFRIQNQDLSLTGPAQVLHVDFGSPSPGRAGHRVASHTHAFWQMEILQAGEITAWNETHEGREEWRMSPGDVFLVPPGVPHSFYYPEGTVEFFSYKFRFLKETPRRAGLLPRSGVNDHLVSLLRSQGPEDFRSGRGEWVAHVLSALMEVGESKTVSIQESKTGSGDLASRIREWSAKKNGRPGTLDELSKDLGYSSAWLSASFKKKFGKSLKRFLDGERARVAAELLAYADLRITEISRKMEFPDVLTFSHFCKKHLGKSPRALRRNSF
ncbi:MAG: helix-turn-helix domain-containing protein [Spirochaetia bacterium]|nr:helix-turn-helix domain-containing protein [Spirochaetia bacterium]